jgi:hypothetical protein
MTEHNLKIELDLPKDIAQCTPSELAVAMDQELGLFQKWFVSQQNAPLMKVERSILKTYLAWKLLYAKKEECVPGTSP